MLDLGETLVHGNEVLPHVSEALAAIAGMRTADGAPVESCLVSDYTMPSPPVTPAKIAAIFDEYLSLLVDFGLKELFEPVERRITLSTHAGYRKPDRRVCERRSSDWTWTWCRSACLCGRRRHLREAHGIRHGYSPLRLARGFHRLGGRPWRSPRSSPIDAQTWPWRRTWLRRRTT